MLLELKHPTQFLAQEKTGEGIDDILENIVNHLPPPKGETKNNVLKCLLVDSWYDTYLGVII